MPFTINFTFEMWNTNDSISRQVLHFFYFKHQDEFELWKLGKFEKFMKQDILCSLE